MKKRNSILRAIDLAEVRFFEENLKNPDILLLNTDGYALLIDEVGSEVMDEDYRYKDKFIGVVVDPGFDLFRLAYSGD